MKSSASEPGDQNKNVALECKEVVRYLGIIIDNKLSWKHHIDHVAIKMSRTVGLICKLRAFSTKTFSSNYLSILCCSLFNLCLTAWVQAYKSHLKKLLKLQKRALRFTYFSERNQHAIPLFIEAGVLLLKLCIMSF